MQVKKDDVKKRIIDAAMHEFLEIGFEKSSLRRIVKSAGTTTGNFYNYFENKDALFDELVRDVYQMFIYVIENHHQWERRDELWETSDVNLWREGLLELIQPLMPQLDNRFLLLIDCSNGTSYEQTRTKFIEVLNEHFVEHIEEHNPNYSHTTLGYILSEQLIHGIVTTLRLTEDIQLRSELITEQILFFAIGVMGILQGGQQHG